MGSKLVVAQLRAFFNNLTGTDAVTTSDTQTLTNKTLTAPVLTTPSVTAPSGTGLVLSKTVTFTENATNTLHTGSVALPAGSTLHNIQIVNTVLWGAVAASLDVGDDDDPDGWFAAVDCKATDLVVGEVLDISNAENWGGAQGVYMVAATGRKGNVAAGNAGVYYGAANTVTATITVTTPGSTAGRTFMTVTYSVGAVTAATPSTP